MFGAFFTGIGRFARFCLGYTVIILVAAIAHRLALWTPLYVPLGAPVFFGFLGLVLLTIAMLAYAVGAFFRFGYRFAGAILIVAILMMLAVILVANIDAPTIIYAT